MIKSRKKLIHKICQKLRPTRWHYCFLAIISCCIVVILQLFPVYSLDVPASLAQAQSLNELGQQAFSRGQTELALDYWKKAETQYHHLKDQLGIEGTQLNQAKALQALGFYRQAESLLTQLANRLGLQPDSLFKANVMLTQAEGLRLLGDLTASEQVLNDALILVKQLQDRPQQQAAHLYLGNTLATQERWSEAYEQYQMATKLTGPLIFAARISQIQMLLPLQREGEIPEQVQILMQDLSQSDSAQTRLYGILEMSRWLIAHEIVVFDNSLSSTLQSTILQARQQGDRKAESYGLGYLGQWHEQRQQFAKAQRLTQQALSLADSLQATELSYQWQWQLGRIARSQGKDQDAIAYYKATVDSLRQLRQGLVSLSLDVQYSFREEIEPVYRDLVSLLLTTEALSHNRQKTLEQARQIIENLQLAELNNFFREPCIEAISQAVDSLDPSSAVLYPIVLPNKLAVILSIPKQPLQYYETPLPQTEIEQGIQQMLNAMRLTSFEQERLETSQRLYDWLIRPAETILQSQNVQTLVFVLDDALRNVPLAALHNGDRYLVEDYQLALSPGLELLQVQSSQPPLAKAKALIAGLSKEGPNNTPLPGVLQEISYLEDQLNAQVLLDEAFTQSALIEKTQRRSYDLVHLATHAQFGTRDEDTFIQTWDGPLQINQLRQLIKQQDNRGLPPALLILSACDTAQGDDQAVLGMAGVAVRSGAQSTLATLWSVNDQATVTFIQNFYDGLVAQGLSKAQAIQYAQTQLIQAPSFQHPYYWAPFVLVGDWM